MSNHLTKPNDDQIRKKTTTKVLKIGKKRFKLSKKEKVIDSQKPITRKKNGKKIGRVGMFLRRVFKNGNYGGKRMSKGKQVFWRIAISFTCVCVIGFVIGMGVIFTWMLQAPPLDLTKFDYSASTTLYDINGNYYQELQTKERRIPVTIDQIPEMVQLAFISIEDQRFYAHQGVDVRGTVKAMLSVLTSGSTEGPGGSTITQQLIKQTHLTSEVSLKRKVMEWKLAYQLEREFTKEEILEAYLNKVNMSYTWGIQSAAKMYFGKDVSELSIAQAAVLASIINSPAYYNPYLYETDDNGDSQLVIYKDESGNTVIGYDKDNQSRALLVVAKMYELGHIGEEEYNIAKNELENNLIGLILPAAATTYTYFTDACYEQVLRDIMAKYNYMKEDAEDLLLNGGLTIETTVDPVIQRHLEYQASNPDNFIAQSNAARNASVAMQNKNNDPTINYIPQVASTIIENNTGYVVGIVGGRGEKTESLVWNRALKPFQIGSSTKPITVYAPGIDSGRITMGSTFDNNRINFGGGWVVGNDPSSYTGMMTVRNAIVKSVNVVAVMTQKYIGNDISVSYAEKFGFTIEESDKNAAALALGGYTHGQSTLAVASAYSVFPNGGYRITPTFYVTVKDASGRVILQAQQETIQVISPETAWIMTTALRQVVQGGTTTRSIPGQQIGGKTGTTDARKNVYFGGFTPRYSTAVWIGYDYDNVTVDGITFKLLLNSYGGGARGAAAFFEKVFRGFYAEKALPAASLPSQPEGVISAGIDTVSGKAPTEVTAKDPRGNPIKSEYFIRGFYPSEADDMHQEVEICSVTGQIAGANCPHVEKKVLLVKDPEKLLPTGARYVNANIAGSTEQGLLAPTETCTSCTANQITGFDFSTTYNGNNIITSVSINAGSSRTLYLKTVSNAGTRNLTSENPTYTSSNSSVATVSGSGGTLTITATGPGTCTITASYTYNAGTSREYTITRTLQVTVTGGTNPGTTDPGP